MICLKFIFYRRFYEQGCSIKNRDNRFTSDGKIQNRKEEFGVDILNVQEIYKMTQVTKIPNAPDFVEGVNNPRGKVISIIDLRTRLKLTKKEADKDTRTIVVKISSRTVGFIVDAVKEVLQIPVNITETPPVIVAGVDSKFIRSVGKLDDRLLILIKLEKVMSDADQIQLQKAV